MQTTRLFIAAVVVAGLLLPACRKREEEGPGERVGREIDRGMEKLGQDMEEAGKRMQEKSKGE